MGEYREDKQAIREVIQNALDGLEGDLYKSDFKEVCEILFNEYEYFTDGIEMGLKDHKEE